MRQRLAVTALCVSTSLGVGGAAAAPTTFELVFDGHHVVADFPTPTGLSHVGTFKTNSSLCPSGSARDIAENDQGVSTRLFACDGSDSTFTAKISFNLDEHGGNGSWQITSGTGALADFRGKGTFSSVLVSGNPSDFKSIFFRSTWQGLVDRDATPPTVRLTHSHIRKLQGRNRYRVQIAASVQDSEGAVAYTLTLADPRDSAAPYVRSTGQAGTGSIVRAYEVHTRATTRAVRLIIVAEDPVGNTSTLNKVIKLR